MPAPALNVRPRPPAESHSRTPPGPFGPSLFDYEGKGKHKGKDTPTVRDTIIVLAGGRHCCIGLGGVGFAPSNEDLAFRDGVCHLMNFFLRTMFKLRQGPVQFWELFLATEQEEFFLKRLRFWNHFGSFFWAGNSTR